MGLLVAGLGACGGDDSDSDEGAGDSGSTSAPTDETTGAGEADVDAFCEGFVNLDEVFAAAPDDPAEIQAYMADTVMPVAEQTRDNVPEELTEPVGVMFEALDAVATSGDFSAFDAPEFVAAQAEVYPALAGTCSYQSVTATAIDYGYQGVPATLEAGPTVFVIDNQSAAGEAHEIGVARIADGVTETAEQILALPEEEAGTRLEFANGAFAPAGGTSGVTMDLTPGHYIYACFIPTGSIGDQEGTGAPHFTAGMWGEFTVS
ncbi:MAG TPA: hypothetical protein VH479_01415 [Acidimicrobiales bacterium]